HRHLVHADPARTFSSLLRGILRHRPLADGRRHRRCRSRGIPTLARRSRRCAGHGRARRSAVSPIRMQRLPRANATVHAPNLAGIYGKPVPLADGRTTIADDRYIRDSILLPQREVAAGYAPIMPSFAGQLSDEEIFDLIAYIRSLAN